MQTNEDVETNKVDTQSWVNEIIEPSKNIDQGHKDTSLFEIAFTNANPHYIHIASKDGRDIKIV